MNIGLDGGLGSRQDLANIFGFGTDNKFLRVQGVRSFTATGNFAGVEVATFSFDFVGRYLEGDTNRWVNIQLMVGNSRAQTTSIRMSNATIRTENAPSHSTPHPSWPTPQGYEGPYNPSYGSNELPFRITTIVNNSEETISYTGPDGVEYLLSPEYSTVWAYDYMSEVWARILPEYMFARQQTSPGGLMTAVSIQIDSNMVNETTPHLRSFDIDNVSVVRGPVIPEPVVRQAPGAYTLEPVWELVTGDRPYLTEGAFQRGLAYNPVTKNLILADRDRNVAVLDAATGAHIKTLSLTGITGGTFLLNKIGVAGDGAIYGVNLTTDTLNTAANRGPVKVYRWADENADPVLVYEGDPSRGHEAGLERRYGDTMAVRGSGMNTQILLAPRFGRNVTILTPDGTMDTFVDNLIETDIPESPAGWLTHGLAFGAGDTFFGKRQPQSGSTTVERGLLEVSFDLVAGTGQVTRTFGPTVFPNKIGTIGIDQSRQLIAGVNADAEDNSEEAIRRPARVFLYDLSTLSEDTLNLPMDTATLSLQNYNGNGTGDVFFVGNMLYVLDTDNGIAAFRVASEATGDGYASWQEANFPGETDPAIVGPMADPSGDGVRNIVKYALGLDPNESSRAGLPAAGFGSFTVNEVTSDYLTLAFTKPDAVDDVGYQVIVSSELELWAADAVLEESISNGDGTTTYIYRDSQPINATERRFMSLELTILD